MSIRRNKKKSSQHESINDSFPATSELQERETATPQFTEFQLTQAQYTMIMNKLPKLFSLQPTKNKSTRFLNELIDKPSRKIERKEPSQKKNQMFANDSIEEVSRKSSFEKIRPSDMRKSERLFLRDKIVFFDLDKDSEPQQPAELKRQEVLQQNVQIEVNSDKLAAELQQSDEKVEQREKEQLEKSLGFQSKSEFEENLIQEMEFIPKFDKSKVGQSLVTKMSYNPQSIAVSQQISRQYKSQEKDDALDQIQQGQNNQKFENEWLILTSLQNHSMAEPFLLPVDQVIDGVKDYYKKIKEPMDLSTIQQKLQQNQYNSSSEFHQDIQTMFMNSLTYHKPKSCMVRITKTLQKYYEHLNNPNSNCSTPTRKNRRR